jgi:hypothetical protein
LKKALWVLGLVDALGPSGPKIGWCFSWGMIEYVSHQSNECEQIWNLEWSGIVRILCRDLAVRPLHTSTNLLSSRYHVLTTAALPSS